MRTLWRLLPALSLAVSVGCSEEDGNVRSISSALTGDVTLSPSSARVVPGMSVKMTIAVDLPVYPVSYPSYESDDSGCGRHGGYDERPYVSFTSPPIDEVVAIGAVTCSPDCSVSTTGRYAFEVSSQSVGKKTVTVAYTKVGETTARSASAVVSYEEPTRIWAQRGKSSPSGSAFAMVANDVQTWRVRVASETGELDVPPCEIELVVDGVLERLERSDCTKVSFRAVRSGEGIVKMRYPGVERVERITVVDGADIAHAELWRLTDAELADVAATGSFLEAHEDPLVLRYRCRTERPVALRLMTADGTIAFGGGLVAENPSWLTVSQADQSAALELLDPRDGSLSIAIPGANLPPLPYVVRTGCPSFDGDVDAGAER